MRIAFALATFLPSPLRLLSGVLAHDLAAAEYVSMEMPA